MRAAVAVVTALSARDLSPGQWLAGLGPLVTADVLSELQWTDPQAVPPLALGPDPARVVETWGGSLVQVRVPTTAGEFGLWAQRPTAEAPWAIARIDWPAGVK